MRWSATTILSAIGVLLITSALGCAPEPKSVPCSNDGDCRSHSDRLNYCLESRCVECVGVSSCAAGKICDNGACVQCVNDQGCPTSGRCVDGSCQST